MALLSVSKKVATGPKIFEKKSMVFTKNRKSLEIVFFSPRFCWKQNGQNAKGYAHLALEI